MTRILRYVKSHAVKQPNGWSCGAMALRHALLVHGERWSVKRCIERCRSHVGQYTDERKLSKALDGTRFCVEHFHCMTPGMCRAQIRWWARRKVPVIVWVDRDESGPWSHVICVVHATARHVWVCDSGGSGPVVSRVTWSQFLARAVTITHLTHTSRTERFDLYGVLARDKQQPLL